MKKHVGVLVVTAMVLMGCVRQQVVAPGSDRATVELSQAALSINRSMQEYAADDQAQAFKVKKQPINPNAYGMGRLATVDWNGPAEPLIHRIAALTHYRVQVFGKPQPLPALVAINEREQYIGDILRQVSLQSRDQIKLLVYPSTKLIELHYLN